MLQVSLQVKYYPIDRFNATDAQLSPQVRRVRKTERRIRPVTKPKTRSSYHLSTFLIVDEVTMGSGPAVAPIHIEKRALRKDQDPPFHFSLVHHRLSRPDQH